MDHAPFWILALVLAGLAPLCVNALHDALLRRLRKRTLQVLSDAGHQENEQQS